MEPDALYDALLALADETGLPVQRLGQPALDGLSPSASGVCRVRGEVRVMLSDSDPLAARIRVLASALRDARGDALEDRFLAPALRACLEQRGAEHPRET